MAGKRLRTLNHFLKSATIVTTERMYDQSSQAGAFHAKAVTDSLFHPETRGKTTLSAAHG
jgi:hypothetical protein